MTSAKQAGNVSESTSKPTRNGGRFTRDARNNSPNTRPIYPLTFALLPPPPDHQTKRRQDQEFPEHRDRVVRIKADDPPSPPHRREQLPAGLDVRVTEGPGR